MFRVRYGSLGKNRAFILLRRCPGFETLVFLSSTKTGICKKAPSHCPIAMLKRGHNDNRTITQKEVESMKTLVSALCSVLAFTCAGSLFAADARLGKDLAEELSTLYSKDALSFDIFVAKVNTLPQSKIKEFIEAYSLIVNDRKKQPLLDHIEHFYSDTQCLTGESIIDGHTCIGEKNDTKQKIKADVILRVAIANSNCEKDKAQDDASVFASTLMNVNNPAATGFWKAGGKVDDKPLKTLVDLAITSQGTDSPSDCSLIINRDTVLEYLNTIYTDREEIDKGTPIKPLNYVPLIGCIPGVRNLLNYTVTWKTVTFGSVEGAFKHLAPIEKRKDSLSIGMFLAIYMSDGMFAKIKEFSGT